MLLKNRDFVPGDVVKEELFTVNLGLYSNLDSLHIPSRQSSIFKARQRPEPLASPTTATT
jgi:hypothetical protein